MGDPGYGSKFEIVRNIELLLEIAAEKIDLHIFFPSSAINIVLSSM